MVRFSQTLGDGQSKNREKPYEQFRENPYYMHEDKQPRIVQMSGDDRMYSQPPRQVYQQKPMYVEERFYGQPQSEEPVDIAYEKTMIERESIKPDLSKPELKFPADQNIQFGVEYAPNSKPPVIGKNYTIRSNSIIYNDVVIGDNFRTGHNVVIRENTNIGDDVLIGTNTVGPCACFTNDKYPVRINYELQGPKIRRGASIGGNTTFLSNVEIGEGAIVAAGAIVIHSVPPFYLAIGTPARIKPLPDHLKVPNKF